MKIPGSLYYRPFAVMLVLFCAWSAAVADTPLKAKLDTCISYYQDGEYQKAVDSIKALLPLVADRTLEAEAYKYLGFSYVMLDMINKAKDFFRVALEKFPQMAIDTLEVPPNITIVFRQTQLEAKMAKGEILDQEGQRRNESRLVVATVVAAAGAVSSGIGGYFLYRFNRSYRHYQAIDGTGANIQDSLDFWAGKYRKELLTGGVTGGVGVVALGVAVWLYLKKPATNRVSVYCDPAGAGLVWRF